MPGAEIVGIYYPKCTDHLKRDIYQRIAAKLMLNYHNWTSTRRTGNMKDALNLGSLNKTIQLLE